MHELTKSTSKSTRKRRAITDDESEDTADTADIAQKPPTKRRKIVDDDDDDDDEIIQSEDDEETEEDRAFLAKKVEKIKSKDEDTAKVNPANIIEGKRTRKPVERYVHPDEEIVTISHGLAVPEEELIAILEMEQNELAETAEITDDEYKPESEPESEEISESDVVSESETYASESEDESEDESEMDE